MSKLKRRLKDFNESSRQWFDMLQEATHRLEQHELRRRETLNLLDRVSELQQQLVPLKQERDGFARQARELREELDMRSLKHANEIRAFAKKRVKR